MAIVGAAPVSRTSPTYLPLSRGFDEHISKMSGNALKVFLHLLIRATHSGRCKGTCVTSFGGDRDSPRLALRNGPPGGSQNSRGVIWSTNRQGISTVSPGSGSSSTKLCATSMATLLLTHRLGARPRFQLLCCQQKNRWQLERCQQQRRSADGARTLAI